jgi:hypothetical protein
MMRYKPKSVAALQIALGGLPDNMRVDAERLGATERHDCCPTLGINDINPHPEILFTAKP